ncbi:MAG: aldo/keto reductase [Clostridia bacterium]|nr:aldo/keto reductase [Clostridia bacterium]NCD02136.1 aldo/keto reductase [Clostridia bacterium]
MKQSEADLQALQLWMEELWRVPKGDHCKVNQVLYHLGSRGIEYALLPWLKEHQVVMMAYCPLAQAGSLRRELTQNASVKQVARKNGLSEMQVLLAFVLYQENVIAIPKAGKPEHIQENAKMADFKLTEEDYQLLSNAFPAPKNKTYLDIV